MHYLAKHYPDEFDKVKGKPTMPCKESIIINEIIYPNILGTFGVDGELVDTKTPCEGSIIFI